MAHPSKMTALSPALSRCVEIPAWHSAAGRSGLVRQFGRSLPVLLVVLLLLPRAACGADQLKLDFRPERPAMVYLEEGDEELPLVASADNQPVVMKNGRRTPRGKSQLSIARTDAYAPGKVELRNVETNGHTLQVYSSGGSWTSEKIAVDSRFKVTLQADRDMEDVFVVVLIFDEIGDPSVPVRYGLWLVDVGHLQAGVPKPISRRFQALAGDERRVVCPIVFSGGRQVQEEHSRQVLPWFFAALDREIHRSLLTRRQQGPDAPPDLFRTFPIELPPALREKYAGRTATVRIRINWEGRVDDVILEQLDDPELDALLQRQLRAWLLLPRIKQGHPIGESIRIPLQFD